MSVYSGFATRQQQQQYDSYTQRILIILQQIIQEILQQQKPHAQFCSAFRRVFKHMKKMEEYKYLKPKLTQCLEPLYKTCKTVQIPSTSLKKIRNIDKSQNSSIYKFDNEQIPSLSIHKNQLLQYQSETNHKKSQSFRSRPRTTKYSSAAKSSSNSKIKEEDEDIKSIVEQYLGGAMKAGLAKAQKHYIKTFKRHQKQYGDNSFSNNNLFKK